MSLVAVWSLVASLQAAPQEPIVYEGKPLATWIEELEHKKYDVADKARKAVKAIGTPAVPALVQNLSSPRVKTRTAAADALEQIGSPEAVPALLALLSDPERSIQVSAVRALGAAKDVRAVDPLLERVAAPGSDKDFNRYAELMALVKIGSPRAVARLQELAAADPRPAARAEILDTFTRWMIDPRLIETLGLALRDPDGRVRQRAAEGLSRYDSPRVIELLESAAADPATGAAAAKALRDVDTRGKPSVVVGPLHVTLLGVETADRWGSWPQEFRAKRGYEFVILRYRIRWAEADKGSIEMVDVVDAEGVKLPTAVASAGRFGFSSFGSRAAGEAITTESAFAAKQGTKLAKCTIQGAAFDLSAIVPTPRKN